MLTFEFKNVVYNIGCYEYGNIYGMRLPHVSSTLVKIMFNPTRELALNA